jgi:hypothetical protein
MRRSTPAYLLKRTLQLNMHATEHPYLSFEAHVAAQHACDVEHRQMIRATHLTFLCSAKMGWLSIIRYTSLQLMATLWMAYKMYLVGTMKMSKKKSRTAEDFPFAKLSTGALSMVARGWLRTAVQQFKGYVAMAVLWKDKKLVGVLDNHNVDKGEVKVKRYLKGQNRRRKITSHTSVKDYSANMGAVDRMDRSIKDWGLTQRLGRYYMRIVFWLVDAAIHNMFILAMYNAVTYGEEVWKRYLPEKSRPRYHFQLDLAQALAEAAIERDWPAATRTAKNKPSWMRQKPCVPCGCGTCFFCKNNMTAGVMTRPTSAAGVYAAKQHRWTSVSNMLAGCVSKRTSVHGPRRKLPKQPLLLLLPA